MYGQKPPSKPPGSAEDVPPPPPPPPTQNAKTNAEPIEPSPASPSQESKEPLLTRSSVPSLDFSPPDPAEQGRTGASGRDNLSSADRRRRAYARVALGLFALGIGANVVFMGREWEPEELKGKKMVRRFDVFAGHVSLTPPPQTLENAPAGRWERTKTRYQEMFNLHPPGMEHTRSINGEAVKDLSYLNRDLSKVILLDTNPAHVVTHPENAVTIPKWKGDPKDNGLVAVILFLECTLSLAFSPSPPPFPSPFPFLSLSVSLALTLVNFPHVRPILSAYHGKDVPTEYAKLEAEGKRKHIENWMQNKGSRSNSFGSFFGVSSRSTQNAPPTYLEQKRKEAQQQYLDEQAQIAKNKDYLESLLKHEQALMAAQAPSNIWEAIEAVRGNPKAVDEELLERLGKGGVEGVPPLPPPPPGMVVNPLVVPGQPGQGQGQEGKKV
ncbi:hypothetical protein GYMLUDRAFT_266045 [Collybiopsis luxurians FD-317 M1]|uniref:Mitochondrial import inner membrane translocase subunit TIM50 n=1 Tax=Collybiopsis luxurians FD-317 M1 TaxID=944289 RepID=A0A0D0B9D8_9AGAR|nr:hypothetical protein GYMLUDRAFT_266045 [Collybiopsis luxurians FD-317 M1]